jgi:hypothetical protein
MKEIKISMGGSSGQGSMVIATLLIALAIHNIFQGIDRGRTSDYIGAVIQISFGGYFALDWFRYWRGVYTMVFDSENYQIREYGIVTATGKFCNMNEIEQDGRGYTVTLENGKQYRVLRKVMDSQLAATLDSVQQKKQNKSCEATGDNVLPGI